MQLKNNVNNNTQQEDVLDIKAILLRIKSSWYWFVVFGTIGALIGFITTKTQYEVSTVLLINEEINLSNGEFLFNNPGLKSNTSREDKVGILSSYMINLEAVKQLDWKTSWYKKDILATKDIYNSSPFEITKIEGETNLTGIPIYVQHLTENTFKIHVDDKYKVNQIKKHIQYDIVGNYGEPIENSHLNFIVNKKYTPDENESDEYYFVFNDYVQLAKNYRAKLDIRFSAENSNLINVKLTGSNPYREVDYLNTLSKVYIQFELNEKNIASENTVKFIDSQLSGVVDSLQQAGKNFTNFRTENRVLDLSQEAGLIMGRLRELESSQSQANMRLDYYKNLQKYMGDAKQMKEMVAPSVVGITDASLNSLVKRLGELYANRNMLVLTVQEKNPSLIAIDREINYTRQTLDENLKNLISNAQLEIRNLNQTKAGINAQMSKLPKTQQSMVNIKRNFDLNNELYTFLLQKRAEAAIAKASTSPKVKTLDIARVENAVPIGSRRIMKSLTGLIVGMTFSALFMIVGSYLNNKVEKKEDITKATDLPLLGLITHNKLKTEFPVLKFPHSSITESFRSIRTNLQYAIGDDTSVIAVQSMISGEGKSFVALNLVMAFAMNNKKVLLVDGDLRKPQVHFSFNDPNNIGLSTFLLNKNGFNEVVKESKIKNLSFVTTGPVIKNSAEILDSERLKDFIAKAKSQFDIVVFNNSPISIVTDGKIIGSHADANLIVIRQNYSKKDQLNSINEFQEQGVLKNISLIFNDVHVNGNSYGDGYYTDNNSKSKPKWKFKPSKEVIG